MRQREKAYRRNKPCRLRSVCSLDPRYGAEPRNEGNLEGLGESIPEELHAEMQRELQAQIAHNVSAGLLLPSDEGKVRYSWRGLLFIWVQFLRDFVSFS